MPVPDAIEGPSDLEDIQRRMYKNRNSQRNKATEEVPTQISQKGDGGQPIRPSQRCGGRHAGWLLILALFYMLAIVFLHVAARVPPINSTVVQPTVHVSMPYSAQSRNTSKDAPIILDIVKEIEHSMCQQHDIHPDENWLSLYGGIDIPLLSNLQKK